MLTAEVTLGFLAWDPLEPNLAISRHSERISLGAYFLLESKFLSSTLSSADSSLSLILSVFRFLSFLSDPFLVEFYFSLMSLAENFSEFLKSLDLFLGTISSAISLD